MGFCSGQVTFGGVGATAVPITNAAASPLTAIFHDQVQVQSAGQEWRQALSGTGTLRIAGISCPAAAITNPTGGATIIKVSDTNASQGGTPNTMMITLDQNTNYEAEVTAGAFNLAAGATLYAWVSQAGGHGDVQLTIRITTV